MVISALLRLIYPPPPSLLITAMSVVSFASLANAGFMEIKGKHMQYSKFWNIGSGKTSSSSEAAQKIKLSSRTGMLVVYTPAFLAGAASFGLFPNEGLRFLLLSSALTIHFGKRIFEIVLRRRKIKKNQRMLHRQRKDELSER
ncbi:unnamed protein product [Ilex paraguariensis]|uniref:Uncharacterized protein n=1 Tax=Ilex paraguariensis TaxID=185542 RepID=A0ABC8TY19_9AQUA